MEGKIFNDFFLHIKTPQSLKTKWILFLHFRDSPPIKACCNFHIDPRATSTLCKYMHFGRQISISKPDKKLLDILKNAVQCKETLLYMRTHHLQLTNVTVPCAIIICRACWRVASISCRLCSKIKYNLYSAKWKLTQKKIVNSLTSVIEGPVS